MILIDASSSLQTFAFSFVAFLMILRHLHFCSILLSWQKLSSDVTLSLVSLCCKFSSVCVSERERDRERLLET